ncbi:hypothetical protein COLO4_05622 [Corchorus olitorius]|uniref:Uncharacterized protein n=1 Tax=Corchorus olitorius TaxID=93759 RepID=A0A1R3KQI4_9ROSI|nr:hypothetical protein COLO4_05622 [Corchorus olitorius]
MGDGLSNDQTNLRSTTSKHFDAIGDDGLPKKKQDLYIASMNLSQFRKDNLQLK